MLETDELELKYSHKFIYSYVIRREQLFRSIHKITDQALPKSISHAQFQADHLQKYNHGKISNNYPFSTMGIIYLSTDTNPSYGMGTLIGRNLVLTAASSCGKKGIFNEEQVSFVPIFYKYEERHHTVKKIHADPLTDFAILQLEKNIGDQLGYLGLCWSDFERMGQINFETYEYQIPKLKLNRRKIKFSINSSSSKRYSSSELEDRDIVGNPVIMNKNGQFYINAIVTRKINEGIYKEFFEEDINKINLWLYEKQYSLNLCNQGLQPDAIKVLMKGDWNSLTVLNLQRNLIGKKGADYLKFKKFPSLKNLNLSKCNLRDQGIQNFLKGSWHKLQKLNLSQNNILLRGIKKLGQYSFDSLEELNLQWNSFQETDAIIEAKWPMLRILEVNFCNLGVLESMKFIKHQDWQNLEKIDISFNNINIDERSIIMEEHSKNQTNKKKYKIEVIL